MFGGFGVTTKWESIWTPEELIDDEWCVVNETSFTGHLVLGELEEKSARFYADLMNEVYNQIKKDFKRIQKENE